MKQDGSNDPFQFVLKKQTVAQKIDFIKKYLEKRPKDKISFLKGCAKHFKEFIKDETLEQRVNAIVQLNGIFAGAEKVFSIVIKKNIKDIAGDEITSASYNEVSANATKINTISDTLTKEKLLMIQRIFDEYFSETLELNIILISLSGTKLLDYIEQIAHSGFTTLSQKLFTSIMNNFENIYQDLKTNNRIRLISIMLENFIEPTQRSSVVKTILIPNMDDLLEIKNNNDIRTIKLELLISLSCAFPELYDALNHRFKQYLIDTFKGQGDSAFMESADVIAWSLKNYKVMFPLETVADYESLARLADIVILKKGFSEEELFCLIKPHLDQFFKTENYREFIPLADSFRKMFPEQFHVAYQDIFREKCKLIMDKQSSEELPQAIKAFFELAPNDPLLLGEEMCNYLANWMYSQKEKLPTKIFVAILSKLLRSFPKADAVSGKLYQIFKNLIADVCYGKNLHDALSIIVLLANSIPDYKADFFVEVQDKYITKIINHLEQRNNQLPKGNPFCQNEPMPQVSPGMQHWEGVAGFMQSAMQSRPNAYGNQTRFFQQSGQAVDAIEKLISCFPHQMQEFYDLSWENYRERFPNQLSRALTEINWVDVIFAAPPGKNLAKKESDDYLGYDAGSNSEPINLFEVRPK